MKKLNFTILALCITIIASAQGIIFAPLTTWKLTLQKAKAENKYIFIDVYATWCAPCKKMDTEVYTDPMIGRRINDDFIAIKVQQDQTAFDSKEIKNFYNDASYICSTFNVQSLPSLIFLSPSGQIIFKKNGYQNVKQFLQLLNQALNLKNDGLYARVEKYRAGQISYDSIPGLIATVREATNDIALATEMAFNYKKNFLDKRSLEEIINQKTLSLISQYPSLIDSKDRLFYYLYKHHKKADSLVNQEGFAFQIVNSVVKREIVYPNIYADVEYKVSKVNPNWRQIRNTIELKYGREYTLDLYVTQARFYLKLRDWKKFTRSVDERLKQVPLELNVPSLFDPRSTFLLNSDAWQVFLYCDQYPVLRRALQWINIAIEKQQDSPNEQYYDTKANLLYKLGHRIEAIETEMKAIQIGQDRYKKLGIEEKYPSQEYEKIIEKMKAAQPTWPNI